MTELALGCTLLDLGVRPVAMAGHSIGEFAAATLAGVFDEADALELIATRARLSADAPEGKMLAVNSDEATALAACEAEPGRLWMAVRNAAGRQVIAGEVAAVERAAAALAADGVKSRALPVNRAYHTPLMAEAERVLGGKLAAMPLQPPSTPLCCNGSGGWMSAETATDALYWAAHVATCVRWAENMDALASKAPATVVEVGSGSSLAPLLAECAAEGAADLATVSTLRHPKVKWEEGLADQTVFAEALGALWERGCNLDWKHYHAAERYIKLGGLPTYAFEEDVHWVDDDSSMYVASSAEELEAAAKEVVVEDAQYAADKAAAAAAEAAEAAGGGIAGSGAADEDSEPSLVRLHSAAPERKWVTAYCLAYAGGSTAAFSELARAAPEWMDVVGIEMPGKGSLADVSWPAEADEATAAEASVPREPSAQREAASSAYEAAAVASAMAVDEATAAEGVDQSVVDHRSATSSATSSASSSISSLQDSGELPDATHPPIFHPEAAALVAGARAEAAMMERLADRLAADAAGSALVLIGWSMGGMLAAELAIALTARGCPPQFLHIAGRMAPGSFIAAGDDVDKYLLASEEMKATDAWKDWLLPMLMADLRADARAEQRVAAQWSDHIAASSGVPPLRCTLQVCAGTEDAAFPPDAVGAWRPLTSGVFETHLLGGGHDILQVRVVELMRLVVRTLLPATPLYAVKWEPVAPPAITYHPANAANPATATTTLAAATPPAAAAGMAGMLTMTMGSAQALPPLSSKSPFAWRTLSAAEVTPTSADFAANATPPDAAATAAAAEGAALGAALASALGLLLYVEAVADVAAQQTQCWNLLRMVQGFVAEGKGGRLVLLCPADATCGGLVAGSSKSISLEAPELAVQRVYVPASLDILRTGGLLGQIEAVQTGWLRWVASIAAAHPAEVDLWVDPSPPHNLLAPRLTPHATLPSSSAPAVDPDGTYLISGGTGGVGGALVAWLLYEQGVPPPNIILLSRRAIEPPHEGVTVVQADISSAHSLATAPRLRELADIDGIFHLAGVLDDGLISNMSEERLQKVVQPKAGLFALLGLCAQRRWRPRWLLAASSTSSLLGYAGQSNYCAANGLLDQMATFGLPSSVTLPADPQPLVLTLNFGPWGEVGMAREGTKAHQLSLASGELPMASSAAIACIAEALRELRAAARSGTLETDAADAGVAGAPHARGLQFAVADIDWWRSPWPNHPLVQGVMRRVPAPKEEAEEEDDAEPEPAVAKKGRSKGSSKQAADKKGGGGGGGGGSGGSGSGGGADGRERVEGFLKGRLSVWQPSLPLVELGLDSLDLVQLRNGFQKAFKLPVPMAYFTNAQQTLDELLDKLVAKMS